MKIQIHLGKIKVKALLLFWCLGSGLAFGADEFEVPPADKHSDIVGFPARAPKEVRSVVDTRFASTLANAFATNNFNSLIITFGECFGGGMMDDVGTAFAATTKPISMTSGSKWNERSTTKGSTPGAAKNSAFARWSQVYSLAHPGINSTGANKNPKESDAYNNAKANPLWTANFVPKPSAQLKTLNNGGNLILGAGTGGSGASNYLALLFVGNPVGRPDFWNDIAQQYKMLIAAGYPATNIVVLFGDGTAPTNAVAPTNATTKIDGNGTRTNLLANLAALSSAGTNTQIYIYIGDHGSKDTGGDALTKLITPDAMQTAANTFYFDPLTADELAALSLPDNTSGPYLEMTVTSMGSYVPSDYTVFLNGYPVNGGDNSFVYGDTNVMEYELPVSVGSLNQSGTNEVWFVNKFAGDPAVSVELYLSMGDIPPVLENYQPLLNISRTGSVATITFAAQAGLTNSLQATYSLAPATWVTIQSIVGADSTVTITDTDAAATKYYRVVVGATTATTDAVK